MKNKSCMLLACFVLSTILAFADEPFRLHRYDSFKALETNSRSIVFFGNSITNMHEWWEAFDNHDICNRGTSGGYSHELLANLESVISGKPAKLFIMIGTNDLGTSGYTPESVCGNIRTMVERTQIESPATQIYVQSILPSTNGSRTLTVLSAANTLIKAMCEEKGVTYIDLWNDLMGITSGNNLSLDGLHLKATGYKIWCDKIAQYVGNDCVYPDDDTANSKTGNLSGSLGMRCSYFGALPVKDGDVLIIGDEMIHGGEWHELLHCDKVKNRGSNWGYAGPSLTNVLAEIPVILQGRSDNGTPAKVFLYTGVTEVNGSTAISSIKSSYQSIVNKIRELAPSTKIYLMSLLPTATSATNTSRVVPFNTQLQSIASSTENVEYVDIYTPMASNNMPNSDYFVGNYVYAKGYAKISEVLATYLTEENATATTVEKVGETNALYSSRTTLMQALVSAQEIRFGTGAGTYPESQKTSFEAAVATANALLSKENATTDELASGASTVQQAVQALLASLNPPTASTDGNEVWHQIYTPLRDSRYLTSNGSGSGVTGEAKNSLAKSMWKFVRRTDGTYDIINREDNSYLNPSASYNSQISTSATAPSAGWTLEYAATAPLYIIHSGTIQLNQTQSGLGYKVYNWSSAQDGQDRSDLGCQFAIEEVEGELSTALETISGEGWYKFQIASGDAAMQTYISAGTHTVLNADEEYRQTASGSIYYYPFKYNAYEEGKAPTAWIHVKKSGTTYQLQGLNGHTLNENCTASRDQAQAPTTITVTGEAATIDKWHYYSPSDGKENPYVGKSSSSSNTFTYARITDSELEGYDHYTVSMIGATNASEVGQDPSVTCTHSDNKGIAKVFDHGHYFFPKGTSLTAADFTATTSGGQNPQIAIVDNTITVLYGDAPDKEALLNQAEELLSHTGIGTPAKDGADRTRLENAVAAATTADGDLTAILALQNAITGFLNSTELEMPQAGKAYTFTNVQQNGTTYVLYAAEDGTLNASSANVEASTLGHSAAFVCGEADGRYYFANGLTGKYLVWKGHKDGTNDNSGYLPSYNATYCLFSVESGASSSYGTVYIQGTRGTGTSGCFILDSAGAFNAWSSGIGFSSTYSDLFLMEETEYPNVVSTIEASDLGHIGLFSAPFPAIAPEGAKAYGAMTDGTKVGLLEMENGIVPARTGAAIVGSGESFAMIPATADGTAPAENLLVASGLEGCTVDAATAAYGLVQNDGFAYFSLLTDRAVAPNSAYLSQEDAEESMRVYLGDLTGIGSMPGIPDTHAPIYDLGGRRVVTPTRGIYIQGGKKILVK